MDCKWKHSYDRRQKPGFAEQWRAGGRIRVHERGLRFSSWGLSHCRRRKKCWISDCPIPDGKWNVYLDSTIPTSWSTQKMESGPLGFLERTGGYVRKSVSLLKFRAHYNPASSQDRGTTSLQQEENKHIENLELNPFGLLTLWYFWIIHRVTTASYF